MEVFPHEPEPPECAKPDGTFDPANPAWVAWQTRQRWERIRSRFGQPTPDALHAARQEQDGQS